MQTTVNLPDPKSAPAPLIDSANIDDRQPRDAARSVIKSVVVSSLALITALATIMTLEASLILFGEGKLNEAERGFRQLLTRDPENAEARLMLARTLVELGQKAEGVSEIEKVLSVAPSAEVRFEAGRILRILAERHFAQLQHVAPHSASTLELDGERMEWAGDLDGALRQYAAAAKLEPGRPGIHYRLGNIYWRKRENQNALTELTKELAASPYHGMANLRMGQLLLNNEDAARSLPFLEKAIQSMPQSAEARRELGKAFKQLGRLARAREEWEAVAKISPGDDRVHYFLGGLYRDLGEKELADRAFQRHREILKRRLQHSVER